MVISVASVMAGDASHSEKTELGAVVDGREDSLSLHSSGTL